MDKPISVSRCARSSCSRARWPPGCSSSCTSRWRSSRLSPRRGTRPD